MWQIDTGHARGMADAGVASTFRRISVWKTTEVAYETYRQNLSTQAYRLPTWATCKGEGISSTTEKVIARDWKYGGGGRVLGADPCPRSA